MKKITFLSDSIILTTPFAPSDEAFDKIEDELQEMAVTTRDCLRLSYIDKTMLDKLKASDALGSPIKFSELVPFVRDTYSDIINHLNSQVEDRGNLFKCWLDGIYLFDYDYRNRMVRNLMQVFIVEDGKLTKITAELLTENDTRYDIFMATHLDYINRHFDTASGILNTKIIDELYLDISDENLHDGLWTLMPVVDMIHDTLPVAFYMDGR